MGQSIEMISQQSEAEINKHNIKEYNINDFIKPTSIDSQLLPNQNQIDTNSRNNQNQIQNVLKFNANLKLVNYDKPQKVQVHQQLRQQNYPKDSLKYEIGATKPNQVGTVLLYGIPIVSLFIDSQERLCLAQISNTLLKLFSYNEIHNRRVALGITCVQCTPVQLEILRRAGAMPASSRRCGMITKREAERLCKSFLGDNAPPRLPDDFAFNVLHECAWGCTGAFLPARYNSSRAKCIKCNFCGLFFSPNKFIFHSHRIGLGDKYVQPDAANFNSWRRHMKLSANPPEEIIHAWEDVKAMFNGGTRKRLFGETVNLEQKNSLSGCNLSGKKCKGITKAENSSTQVIPTVTNSKISNDCYNEENNTEIIGTHCQIMDSLHSKTASPGQILLENQVAINITDSQETNLAAVVAASRLTGTSIADFRIPFSSNFMMDYMLAQQQQQPQLPEHYSGNFRYPNYPLPLIKVRQQQNTENDSTTFDIDKSIIENEKTLLDSEKSENVLRRPQDHKLSKIYENSAFKPVKSTTQPQSNHFKNHSLFSSAAVLATASIFKKFRSATFVAAASQQQQQSFEIKANNLANNGQNHIFPRTAMNNRETTDQKFKSNEFNLENREISHDLLIPNALHNFQSKQNFRDMKETCSSINANTSRIPLNSVPSTKMDNYVRIDIDIDEIDNNNKPDDFDPEDEDILVDIETTEEDESFKNNNQNFTVDENTVKNNVKHEKTERKMVIVNNFKSSKTNLCSMDSNRIEFVGEGKIFRTNILGRGKCNEFRHCNQNYDLEFVDVDNDKGAKQKTYMESMQSEKPQQNIIKNINISPNEFSNIEDTNYNSEKTKKIIEINFNKTQFLVNCDSNQTTKSETEDHNNKTELVNESLWLNSELCNESYYRTSATFLPIFAENKTSTKHSVS